MPFPHDDCSTQSFQLPRSGSYLHSTYTCYPIQEFEITVELHTYQSVDDAMYTILYGAQILEVLASRNVFSSFEGGWLPVTLL